MVSSTNFIWSLTSFSAFLNRVAGFLKSNIQQITLKNLLGDNIRDFFPTLEYLHKLSLLYIF